MPLTPIDEKPTSLTTKVFERLREAIVSFELPPGTHLSENKLAAVLGASKTPVRESLLRLAHVGLAVPGPQGLRVVSFSEDLMRNAYEVRAALESEAAALAATRASAADKAAILEAAVATTEELRVSDPASWHAHSRRFHSLTAEASGNARLAELIEDQYLLTWVLRQRDSRTAEDSAKCTTAHLDIAVAIRDGDCEAARRGCHAHFQELISIVTRASRADGTTSG